MAEIVNLSGLRKRKARAEAEHRAAENRARFGRTKGAKLKEKLEAARARSGLEEKRLDEQARAPFALKGLDHVVLRYRDVARGVRFYCTVLGCGIEKVQAEIGLTQLRAGSTLIDLVDVAGKLGRAGGAAPGRDGRNLDHFCLQIAPWDADAIARHLRAHGIEPGRVERRYGAEGYGPSIYLDDPEGNQIELKGPPER